MNKHPLKTNQFCICSALLRVTLTSLTLIFAVIARTADGAISHSAMEQVTAQCNLGAAVIWTGDSPPDETQSQALLYIMRSPQSADVKNQHLEDFLTTHPLSPWAGSLHNILARCYKQQVRYSLAAQNWQAAWNLTKTDKTSRGKEVADEALANLANLWATLGKKNSLEALLTESETRLITSSELLRKFQKAKESLVAMENEPETSFRCGAIALHHVAKVLHGRDASTKAIDHAKSPTKGFSMSALIKLASLDGLDLIAAERPPDGKIIVPSVLHWKADHYAAIVEQRGKRFKIVDNALPNAVWMDEKMISQEATGFFLVPMDKMPKTWKQLSQTEAENISGGGGPNHPTDPRDGCSNSGGGGNQAGGRGLGQGGGDNRVPIGNLVGPLGCQGCGGNNSGGDGNGQPPKPPGSQPGSPTGPAASCPPCKGSGNSGGNPGNKGNPANPKHGATPPIYAPHGMPIWTVSEPYINTWIHDEPLGYEPGVGYRVAFKLSYKQREDREISTNYFSCGPKWNFSWFSYIIDNTNYMESTTMNVAGGGQRSYNVAPVCEIPPCSFPPKSQPEYYSFTELSRSSDFAPLTNYTVAYPDGAVDYYRYISTVTSSNVVIAFLSEQVDPAGHTNRFEYDNTNNTVRLRRVIDADGRTNTVNYDDSSFPAQITSVTDPFNRTTYLYYDETGMLSEVVDVAGISSSFVYDDNQWVTNLITPYGATTFSYTDTPLEPDGTFAPLPADWDTVSTINRSVMVVDAVGGTNLYLYRDSSKVLGTNFFLPYAYTNEAPEMLYAPCNVYMYFRNSWHWGPKQFSNLSTNDMNYFTVADYRKGRMRNWLHGGSDYAQPPYDYLTVSDELNMEQEPSPDGLTAGQKIWYYYDGQGSYYENIGGSHAVPTEIGYRLSDDSTHYTYIERNRFGHPTGVTNTYSIGFNSSVFLMGYQYVYDVNDIDLLLIIGPTGETTVAYGYDAYHHIVAATNASGDWTTFAYDAAGRFTGSQTSTGLTTTNLYYSSGYTNYVEKRIDIQINRTNSYTYTNNLILTQTDERGLTTTNTWDNLQRLTSQSSPEGTISNIYFLQHGWTYPGGSGGTNVLDLTGTKDRLGNWTYFGHDAVRRLIAVTNALGSIARYNYCSCGALDSIQDALTNTTSFYYDNAGRRVATHYPDGSVSTNYFNVFGQVTNTVNGTGVSITNWFNNQGLLYASSNAFGRVFIRYYDLENRVTNSVDANGAVMTNLYDDLGRLLRRGYSDGGIETFGYSAVGLVFYTNQLGFTTALGYDEAGRKIAETNANGEVTQFKYDSSGNLTNLIDGNNHNTFWKYDLYGRLTNKVDHLGSSAFIYTYDANGQLSTRTTPAKGTTTYYYDDVGNLTNVDYPASHDLTFQYDALNRLTNMVDAVGTTKFTYTEIGLLRSEDGPWGDDTVSYDYLDRRRVSLGLLHQNASPWLQTYNYDNAARLQAITSPAGTFTYDYHAGLDGFTTASGLVKKIELPNGSYITNTFDDNGRLTGTYLDNSSDVILDKYVYGYNQGNQRTSVTRTAGDFVDYHYDAIGQLTNAIGKEFGGTTNRMHEQLSYIYDSAGNLSYRTNNTLVQNFAVNALNELTAATNGGRLTVVGTTSAVATNVSVNATNALLYADNTFVATNMPITSLYTAVAKDTFGRQDTTSVSVNLPSLVNFQYDSNGNLTNDNKRIFEFDDENQLTTVWVSNAWKSTFAYDGRMRCRIETNFSWISGAWVATNVIRFIYEGNLALEYRDGNNLPTKIFTRGKDLGRKHKSAGGIGGLLAVTENPAARPEHSYYHADGNGNITILINSAQSVVARYIYDSFGNSFSASGPKAFINPYRFSSKRMHELSGLYDYLFRWYVPEFQRWLNRDPIGEKWSDNLYDFVANAPIANLDTDGLEILYYPPGNCTVNAPPCKPTIPSRPPTLPRFPVGPIGPAPTTAPRLLPRLLCRMGGLLLYVLSFEGDRAPGQGRPACPPQPTCNAAGVTICHKVADWFEPHPWEPDTGERLCKYKCNDGQEFVKWGSECDEETITEESY